MAVVEKVKAKMPDRVVAENTPRYISTSNGLAEREIQIIGEHLRTHRYDTQNLYMTRITLESTVWPWLVRHAGFCVTRYARGAGGITPFRAAYDQDYTQEIVPFAKTALFKIKAPEHLGLSSGRRLRKGDTTWEKGTSLGQKKNGERFENWSRRNAQKLHCCSRYKDLVPNARRRGRRKRHPTLAPVLPPVHRDPTDGKSSSSSVSTSSSSSMQAQGEIPRHVTVRAPAQTDSRSQQQTAMGANVLVVPAANVLSAVTPKAHSRSSTPTKRAAESMTLDVPSQAKRSRGEDSQIDVLKFDSGWNRDVWN